MKTTILLAVAFLFTLCTTKPDVNVLLDTDCAFSQLSKEKGMDHAFLEYIDEQGIMLSDNAMPLIGKEAVRKKFASRDDSQFTLTWEPLSAEISASADMGFTYGIYTITVGDSVTKGTYVSVWKKNEEGQWKFVLDSGNEGLGE